MTLNSYAKINIFLEIHNRMENNYHSITSLFSEIELHDILKFSLTKNQEINLLSNIENLEPNENLVYKIAIFIKTEFCVQCGALIELKKMIPISAGLGGGSSNGASTIKGLSKLWNLNLTNKQMHEIASEFGSDINFFIEGYQAIGTNRGEIIEPIEQSIFIDNILLINPGFAISSAEAYNLYSESAEKNDELNSLYLKENIAKFQYPKSCFNRLEAVICKKYPEIQSAIEKLYKHGATKAILSGSGPTMIGFFDNPYSLENARKEFADMNFWTYKTSTRRRQKP